MPSLVTCVTVQICINLLGNQDILFSIQLVSRFSPIQKRETHCTVPTRRILPTLGASLSFPNSASFQSPALFPSRSTFCAKSRSKRQDPKRRTSESNDSRPTLALGANALHRDQQSIWLRIFLMKVIPAHAWIRTPLCSRCARARAHTLLSR